MKDLIDKISSYNLFNYLFPGFLFVCISKHVTSYNFIQDNEIIGAFLYYFIGMVISRFGSLFIEPFLKWISFIKFSNYKEFVVASKKDEKIELFSEVNNTYRTITSLFLVLLIVKAYNYVQIHWMIPNNITLIALIIAIFVLFLFSYRKQTNYITKRIKSNSDSFNN
jgi:hypothetical protein